MKKAASVFLRTEMTLRDVELLSQWMENPIITRYLNEMSGVSDSLRDRAGKIHRLLDYTARPGDVADPWYTGDFSTTWRDVAEGCRGLLKAITSQAM